MKTNMLSCQKNKLFVSFLIVCLLTAVAITHTQLAAATSPSTTDDDTIVRCDPIAPSGSINGTFTVDLYIENVTDLYGADIRTSFDANKMQVVDAQPNDGIQIELLDDFLAPDFVLRNEADNAAGTIKYAATQLNPAPPVSGSGAVARITFQAIVSGTTTMEFTNTQLATRTGTAIPAVGQNCTITVSDDPCSPTAEVWVDVEYSSDGDNGGHVWGCDAFNNIQSGIDKVKADGTVHVATGTYNEALTISKPIVLSGEGSTMPQLNAEDNTAVVLTNTSATIKGFHITDADTLFAVNGGQLMAYANQFTNYSTAIMSTNAGEVNGRFNWWGQYTTQPTGLDAASWQKRLGAPIVGWAEGENSAEYSSNVNAVAILNGGLGTAVIINHSRPPNAPLLFGNNFFGHAQDVCSDFFTFFVLDAIGSWQTNLRLDDSNDCTPVLTNKALYQIPVETDTAVACTPTSESCWQAVNPANITIHVNHLIIQNLTSETIQGLPLVAGTQQLIPAIMQTYWLPIIMID